MEKIALARAYQPQAEGDLAGPIANSITTAFRTLIEGKHLYQSVDVNMAEIEAVAGLLVSKYGRRTTGSILPGSVKPAPTPADYILTGKTIMANASWGCNITAGGVDALLAAMINDKPKIVRFEMPETIHTHCRFCKEVWPFNPVHSLGKVETSGTDQWFFFAYACQSCKKEPVRFLVRRQGLKLRLCGRDPISEVTAPDVLPKEQRDHFASSAVACGAGQTLAGIFFLRVFVEQFYRAMPTVAAMLVKDPRLTGDAMGELYLDTLPQDFKVRFPSLRVVYSELSEAIHGAKADLPLYQKSAASIIEHFEARKLFKL